MQAQRASIAGGAVVAALVAFSAIYFASAPGARGVDAAPVRIVERPPRIRHRVLVKVTERQRVGVETYLAQLPDVEILALTDQDEQDPARRARHWRRAQRRRALEEQRERREWEKQLKEEERELNALLEAAAKDAHENRDSKPAENPDQGVDEEAGQTPETVKSPEPPPEAVKSAASTDAKTPQPEGQKAADGEKRASGQETSP